MVPHRTILLKYFLRSGRGGGTSPSRHIPKDLCPPDGRLTPTIPVGKIFKWPFQARNSSCKRSPSSLASRTFVLVKLLASRFVTVRLKDTNKTMRKINPFYIQKALDSVAEKVTNASCMKTAALFVEALNGKQKEVLLNVTLHVSQSCTWKGTHR
jgi:hypothetical protein